MKEFEVTQTYQKITNSEDTNKGFYYIKGFGGVSMRWIRIYYWDIAKQVGHFTRNYPEKELDRSLQKDGLRSSEGIYYKKEVKPSFKEVIEKYSLDNGNLDLKSLLNLLINQWQKNHSIGFGYKEIITTLKSIVKEKKAERREKMRLAKKKI